MEKFKLVETEEYKKCSIFRKILTFNTLMHGTQIDKFPIEKIFRCRKFSMPILMEEVKPVVLLKYDFERQEKSKLKCFLLSFQTIRLLLMRGRKVLVFQIEYSSASVVFSTEILVEEIELVMAEN